jgi:hypothetical protein
MLALGGDGGGEDGDGDGDGDGGYAAVCADPDARS